MDLFSIENFRNLIKEDISNKNFDIEFEDNWESGVGDVVGSGNMTGQPNRLSYIYGSDDDILLVGLRQTTFPAIIAVLNLFSPEVFTTVDGLNELVDNEFSGNLNYDGRIAQGSRSSPNQLSTIENQNLNFILWEEG